ncbi:PC-esterase domain-containing protein 1A [Liparis tanakae]|uniref:PC-esterase domain-containing protein 1A n=1 Tax=Liparis tanakae TaxID=230148 RepID=A0A4Z2F8B0_9TELE|nr:PC-esterase domain-containing protein 1A [Liparis tanakae]
MSGGLFWGAFGRLRPRNASPPYHCDQSSGCSNTEKPRREATLQEHRGHVALCRPLVPQVPLVPSGLLRSPQPTGPRAAMRPAVLQSEAGMLLHNKFVRSMYKDLVLLLQRDQYLTATQLKAKAFYVSSSRESPGMVQRSSANCQRLNTKV